MDFKFFIKSVEKMRTFCHTFQIKDYLNKVKDLNLSHLLKINHDQIESNDEPQVQFGNGMELFRQKGEPITDFCIKGDTLAIALQSKGMREISISSSLMFRNRTANNDLVDEELFSWYDCLHRFD